MTTAPVRPLLGPNGQALNGSPVAVGQPSRAGDWRPIRTIGTGNGTVWEKDQTVTPTPKPRAVTPATPVRDPLAEAEAEAIRARAASDREAARIKAEAEAEAVRAKAEAEAEKQRLANERNAMRLEREKADHNAKIAEANRKRETTERETETARKQAEAEEKTAAAQQAKVEASADSWRKAAIGFAIICGIVALPVQMHAFYNKQELWLLAAPLMLEGGAWVVNRGARAAVDEHRPHWHYRAISWTLATISAAINFAHGIQHFDVATAIGTAFASLAGPGVWDLHEHGRIRLRDGKLTRAERRAKRAEDKRIAVEKAAAEKAKRAEEKAAAEAAKATAEKLAADRAEKYPQEWKRAMALAAAVGEPAVSESVWRRAWRDLHAADPGETVDVVRSRNVAALRMARAVTEGADKGTEKSASSQLGSQMPPARRQGPRTGPTVRGVRRPGDTQKYVNAARKQAAITAKQAVNNEPKEG